MVDRKFAAFDAQGKPSFGPLFVRKDGLLTRNAYGYDLADLVCQRCVRGDCALCLAGEHEFAGYSVCPCNGDKTLLASTIKKEEGREEEDG